MIALPPGCSVAYGVRIDVTKLTDDIVEWFRVIGGQVHESNHYNWRGIEVTNYKVSYGRGKQSYTEQTGVTRIHFLGEDASVASMFLLKFSEHVTYHNLKEADEAYHY